MLDRHDVAVRRQLERFGGREVKTTGDGFLVTFDGPARAVTCAQAIRDAAAQMGMEIRVGLHTGEIALRGDDIAGMAVHIAARVEALARPGEVLASRTVVDLIVGSGIEFEDRGEHELKGVPGSWKVFAVTGLSAGRSTDLIDGMGSHVNELPRFLIHDRVQLSDLASTSSWGGSCGAHDLVQSDPGLSSRTVPDRSPWDTLGRSTPPGNTGGTVPSRELPAWTASSARPTSRERMLMR